MRGSGHPQLEVRRTMIPLEARWSFNKAQNRGSIGKSGRSQSRPEGWVKGADSRGMATVLRRVREPRKKSDGLPSRGREQKRVGRSRSIARSPSGESYRFYPLSGPAASTLRECFCPRSRKTSSAAAPVDQLACRPRATARNAVRDWNSVPVLLERKAGGFATSEEFLCHV